MKIRRLLKQLNLTTNNSVVIGSGILQSLGIRDSKDIDLVVTSETYNRLKETGKFEVSMNHGHEVLKDDTFEIGTSWEVLGKPRELKDFTNDSIIIDEVRYITLDFLYRVKNSWLKEGTARPKDMNDLRLIEEYKNSNLNN